MPVGVGVQEASERTNQTFNLRTEDHADRNSWSGPHRQESGSHARAGRPSSKVANSRGPETIAEDVLEFGAQAVAAPDAVRDVEVLILSVTLGALPGIVPLVALLPIDGVLIDTSNYYPHRDGRIDALEDGQVESLWVTEQLGRSVVKAWNAIGSDSLARLGARPTARVVSPFPSRPTTPGTAR